MRLAFCLSLPLLVSLAACGTRTQIGDLGAGGSSGDGGAGGSMGDHMTSNSGPSTTTTASSGPTSVTIGSTAISSSSTGPSDVYPAPHPPAPTSLSVGGQVQASPKFVPIFFANEKSQVEASVQDFMKQIAGSQYWLDVGAEYGIGGATTLPSIELAETAQGTITDDQIAQWLAGKLNSDDPQFPPNDANTQYVIFYPQSVTVDAFGEESCTGFGGYHLSVPLDAAHGGEAVYAVLPRCDGQPGMTTLEYLTGATSHELFEAATDPYPYDAPAFNLVDDAHIAWEFVLGAELGDLCAQNGGAFTYVDGIDYMIQRMWSNKSASSSHDPCVPVPSGEAYFNTAPVENDAIHISDGVNTYATMGTRMAVGETRTIDLQLFSDAPTSGPWDVQVFSANEFSNLGGSLDLQLDETSGWNGSTLHLTIYRRQPGDYGFETYLIYSTLQGTNQSTTWVGTVAGD